MRVAVAIAVLFLGATAAAQELPPLTADRWVNSPPLTAASLRGKVVLIDIWEFTCVNWIRTKPYVKAWATRYAAQGLVVVGVHNPEFEFGKLPENIDRGIRDHGLPYPIAVDNSFAIWTALKNDAWPAKYLFDGAGKLRGSWIGEDQYAEVEDKIRELLVEAGAKKLPPVTDEVVAYRKMPMNNDPFSAETYVGTDRREPKDGVTLVGGWKSAGQYIEHVGVAPAKIVLDFVGGEVNLVMQPGKTGTSLVGRKLDGKDIGPVHLDRGGMVVLWHGKPSGAHRIELSTSDDGVRAYVFTFGP